VANACRNEAGYGARSLAGSAVASPWDEAGDLFLGLRLVLDGDPASAQEFQDHALAAADVQDLPAARPPGFFYVSPTPPITI
jgi:hypothetical protein